VFVVYDQLDVGFAGSNPAEGDGFLRAIKISSTSSFRREEKPWASCRKYDDMLNIPAEYDRDTTSVKFEYISCHVSPASLLGISATTRKLCWMNQE
jgi:hypothetical protein